MSEQMNVNHDKINHFSENRSVHCYTNCDKTDKVHNTNCDNIVYGLNVIKKLRKFISKRESTYVLNIFYGHNNANTGRCKYT